MVETRRRSLLKAISWRVVAVLVTATVAWAITRELYFAATIGVADSTLKIGLFYLHERAWDRSKFGRTEPPEYQI